jgi:hypothetical protein
MKLYRFAGRAELFLGCGYLPLDHTVMANLAQLAKYATKWRTKARKDQLEHHVYIDELEIATFSKALLVNTLTSENTEWLVESSKRLQQWDWSRSV